jgi:hypothetical protein
MKPSSADRTLGRIGREWRRARELENSELSLIPMERGRGEGSAEGKREERETREGNYRVDR